MDTCFVSEKDDPEIVQQFGESPLHKVTDLRQEGMRATFKKELRKGWTHMIQDSEDGGGEDMAPPPLPSGIFGQSDTETRLEFMESRDLVVNNFNRDDYESGSFDREQPESYESLFMNFGDRSIWDEEPLDLKTMPSVDSYERYIQRYDRWTMLMESFLPMVYIWLQDEAAPLLQEHTTKSGNKTFRFVFPIKVLKSLGGAAPCPVLSVERPKILHASWHLSMIQRFKFNKNNPGKTWLSAEHMHLLRRLFIGLADNFCIPEEQRPKIVEKLKVEEKRQRLVSELQVLNNRYDRAVMRLKRLAWEHKLSPQIVATATRFLNDLAEKIDRTQDVFNLVIARMMQAEDEDSEEMDASWENLHAEQVYPPKARVERQPRVYEVVLTKFGRASRLVS